MLTTDGDTDMAKAKAKELRPVTEEGEPIRLHLYRELKREIDRLVADAKDRRRDEASSGGEPLVPGETYGKTWYYGAIVTAFLRLDDEDRKTFLRSGKEGMLICRSKGRGYRGSLPFERNAESVFRPIVGETLAATPVRGMKLATQKDRPGGTKPKKQG